MKNILLICFITLYCFQINAQPTIQRLNYGDTIEDEISIVGSSKTYSIYLEEGDLLWLRQYEKDIALTLDVVLHSPNGDEVDSTISNNFEYTALVSGVYTLNFKDFGGSNLGKFVFSVERGFKPPTTIELGCDNTSTTGIIHYTAMPNYSFYAKGLVRLKLVFANFIGFERVILRDSEGTIIASEFDEITINLLDFDCYTVYAMDHNGREASVSFTLNVEYLNAECEASDCTKNVIQEDESQEEICGDGKDNDGNGFTDCEDSACQSVCEEDSMSTAFDGLVFTDVQDARVGEQIQVYLLNQACPVSVIDGNYINTPEMLRIDSVGSSTGSTFLNDNLFSYVSFDEFTPVGDTLCTLYLTVQNTELSDSSIISFAKDFYQVGCFTAAEIVISQPVIKEGIVYFRKDYEVYF